MNSYSNNFYSNFTESDDSQRNSGDFIIVDVVVGNNTGEAIVIMPASLQLMIYPNPFN